MTQDSSELSTFFWIRRTQELTISWWECLAILGQRVTLCPVVWDGVAQESLHSAGVEAKMYIQGGSRSEWGRGRSDEVTRAWDLEQAEVWYGWIRQFYGYGRTLDAKGLPLMVPAVWHGDSDSSPKGLSRTLPHTWPELCLLFAWCFSIPEILPPQHAIHLLHQTERRGISVMTWKFTQVHARYDNSQRSHWLRWSFSHTSTFRVAY